MVRESTTSLKLYVNGSLILTNTNNVGSRGSATRLELGNATTANDTPLNGRVAYLKAWTAALSEAEILAEVNAIRPVRALNLYGFWPAFPGSGERIADYSGNGRSWTEGGTLTDEDPPPVSWGAGPLIFLIAGAAEAQEILPSGIPSEEVFGSLTVASLPPNIQPSGIASEEAFGTAALRLEIKPTGIESGEIFGTPYIGLQVILPTGIASAEAFGMAAISLRIIPLGIVSAEVFGTPQLAGHQNILPTGVESAVAFGSPIISAGGAVLGVEGIQSALAWGYAVVETEPLSLLGTDGVYLGHAGSEVEWLNCWDLASLQDLSISDRLGAGNDSLSFTMRVPRGYTQTNELPLSGQLVKVSIGDAKLFEGTIGSVENTWLESGPTAILLKCSGNSYTHLLDRHLVVATREEERAGVRVRAILKEFAPDFADDLTGITDGPIIPPQDYDYQTVTSVISSIARMIGYLWDVTYDRKVLLFANLDEPAPIQELNLDSYTVPGDISISVEPVQANVVIIKDFSSKSRNPHSHEMTADGRTSFFKLPMPPFSIEDTEVYVKPEGGTDWVKRLLLEDPLDGSPSSVTGVPGVAYLCTFNWGVRFPTSDMPGPGDTVRVDYHPEIPDRVVVVMDEDSIRECARRESSDGRHEMYMSASDYRVSDELPILRLGEMILARTAWPVISGSMVLRTQDYGAWKPGQWFTIYSADRDIYDVRAWVKSNYTTKMPQRVWVTEVTRKFEVHPDGIWEYDEVQFTSQPWGEI